MKEFIKNNWFRVSILVLIFIAVIAIIYYFAIFLPQKERLRLEMQRQEQFDKELKEQEVKNEAEKQANINTLLLESCLSEADNSLESSFISLCSDDERISGGDNATCSIGTIDDKVSFMTASNLYNSLFKRILDKRDKERNECFKRYP